jgi:hypothetical protein
LRTWGDVSFRELVELPVLAGRRQAEELVDYSSRIVASNCRERLCHPLLHHGHEGLPNGQRITGERATEGSDPSEARARVRCMRVLDGCRLQAMAEVTLEPGVDLGARAPPPNVVDRDAG